MPPGTRSRSRASPAACSRTSSRAAPWIPSGGFLTGASEHDEYRGATGSYVRYFTAQGYAAHYAHPGYSWFYDRERVNDYLGFERSVFTENGFGELVDPYVAMWHSDQQLADYLLADLDAADGSPLFSFAVSYQNHGPYAETESTVPYVSPEASGWSQESCNMLNNYLFGVNETVREYVRLTQELDARDTPVVLVLFGDHKPWMGNGGSVYEEMGIDFDTSTLAGFRNYYATPYLIWANRAAKEVLARTSPATAATFSPCFLMTRLFDACGGPPGYMQLSRAMRDISPLLHTNGLFLHDGVLTSVSATPTAASTAAGSLCSITASTSRRIHSACIKKPPRFTRAHIKGVFSTVENTPFKPRGLRP